MDELRLAPGAGLGWRPQTAWLAQSSPSVGFVEVLAENLAAHPRERSLVTSLAKRGRPVVVHGVGLSLGSPGPLDPRRLALLAELGEGLDAPLVSEHVAFVRGGAREAGHLLPVPRTKEMLRILTRNVRIAMAELMRPLALENIAALFAWPDDEMDEAEFLSRLVEATGAWLLLDVANLFAAVRNHGIDPGRYLDRLPLSRVAYLHLGGGTWSDGFYQDTHAHPVPEEAWTLLDEVLARTGPRPVLLERDDRFPRVTELEAELERIGAAVGRAASAKARAGEVPAGAGSRSLGTLAAREEVRNPGSLPGGEGVDGSGIEVLQAGVVASLLEGGAVPSRFDPVRFGAARRALARKAERIRAW